MPHHSTRWSDRAGPAATALSRSAVMSIRRVLHAYREGWLPEGRLAAAARLVADDARRQGHGAAQMLVALKQDWATLDGVQQLMPTDAQELLDRLVTLAIRAYYSAPLARGANSVPARRAQDSDARTAA